MVNPFQGCTPRVSWWEGFSISTTPAEAALPRAPCLDGLPVLPRLERRWADRAREAMNDRSNAKPMLIGGEWIAEGEEAIVSVNPANGQVNYEICAATPRHVDAAVESARQAVSAPAWRDM